MSTECTSRPAWLPDHLVPYWLSGRYPLLTALIVGEAEGEPDEGKLGVACVVRNRVMAPHWWGHDYNTVILMPHQFSCYWADFKKRQVVMGNALREPMSHPTSAGIAMAVLTGENDITDGATHYHAVSVKPQWSYKLLKTCRIGNHVFYRE